MKRSDTLDQLKAQLDPKSWTETTEDLAAHLQDWRGRYHGHSPLLIKPSSVDDVSRIVAFCHDESIAILPQGGNTGLVGGSTPQGEIILSLQRMNQIRSIDKHNESLICEAGTILETVQTAAAHHDKLFPLSLGAQGSAQIGGLISTNAGGVHVLRYGMMRDLVLGLEAVLPDGTRISDLSGLRKNNTGYDLKQLLIGAEGTLGVVTAANLKLFVRPNSTCVAIAAVQNPGKAVELLDHMRSKTGGAVAAFELMPIAGLDLVYEHIREIRNPLQSNPAWVVLIEVTSDDPDRAKPILEQAMESAFESGLTDDGVIAQSEAQAAQFWKIRESIPEAEKAHGKATKHDVSVPISSIPEFINDAIKRAERFDKDIKVIAFGHVGDGNVHFNIGAKFKGADQAFLDKVKPLTSILYDLVDQYQGSISAEHGIGILKQEEFAARMPAELAVMRKIKSALDPKGIMNPRVLFPE